MLMVFLLPNKAGPDRDRCNRGVTLAKGGPTIKAEGSKLELIAAAVVERVASARGDCMQ